MFKRGIYRTLRSYCDAQKRGISTVVASVLIVLVTIVGVTVLWVSLDSFLKQDVRPFDARLSIITSTGYTFYDPDEKTVLVQVAVVSGEFPDYVQLILTLEDGSELISVHDAPLPNARKILFLDVDDRYTQGSKPVKVSVAPIYIIDGSAVVGNRINPISLPVRGEDETYYSSFGDPSAPNGADISSGPLASGGGTSSGDDTTSHGTPPDLCPLITECSSDCFGDTVEIDGDDYYTICTCFDLAQISLDDTEKENFILMHDIDCRGVLEDPVGGEDGEVFGTQSSQVIKNFNGNGKIISHVLLDKAYSGTPSNTALGLFTHFSGNVYDLTLDNVTIKGEGYDAVGGLVGYLHDGGKVYNVVSKNSRNTWNIVISTAQPSSPGGTNVGGLVGVNDGLINDSNFRLQVTGASSVGGLVGRNNGVINNSHALGSFSTSLTYGGGLVGYNSAVAIIDSSYATSGTQSSAASHLGGLVGINYGVVNRSYSIGHLLIGNRNIGGLVGTSFGIIDRSYAQGDVFGSQYIGGLVGILSREGTVQSGEYEGKIILSYASGEIGSSDMDSVSVGGLVGSGLLNCEIVYSYAHGLLSGRENIGGLAGSLSGCTLEESYSASILQEVSTEAQNIGGLIVPGGQNTISDSYYDSTVNTCNKVPPLDCPDNSYGQESSNLQGDAQFLINEGWDFSDTDGDPAVWKFDSSISEYAVLDWQEA